MKKFLFILIFLSLPAFALMLRFGIYTMHDFHVFRLYEFTKCFSDSVFPCRWSSNSGMGYGEPLFNFYGQFPYWLGQLFRTASFSIIDSTKAVFILSLVGSGLAMFVFSRRYWGNLGGLISGIFYMYAPYRAVDVWVRGALPEALSFVFFPLIFYYLDRYLFLRKTKYLLLFSVLFAILIINHNLSTYMIAPFLFIFWAFNAIRIRSLKSLLPLVCSGILSLLLTSFYLLPVIFENSLTTVTATTQSYYNYQLHYATLKQLFLSRFWGYGGSVWGPNDNLSFSVGHLHWVLPILIGVILIFFKKKRPKETSVFTLAWPWVFLLYFLLMASPKLFGKPFPVCRLSSFPGGFYLLRFSFCLSRSAYYLAC
jgi:uncharacterized membrane protein